MGRRVILRHETVYTYDRSVRLGPHEIRLQPAPHGRTPIRRHDLRVTPRHTLHAYPDPLANPVVRATFAEPTRELAVRVELEAELAPRNPFDFVLDADAAEWPFPYRPDFAEVLAPFLRVEAEGARFAEWRAGAPRGRVSTVDLLVGEARRVAADVAYEVRDEEGVWSPERTLELGRGSCRDTAWLLVQTLRHLGVAARFASGYLVQLVADLPEPGAPRHDDASLHAWAEAYLPGAGWIGLDPTSGLLAAEGHLPLACTARPEAAAPIQGTHEPCEVDFAHRVGVERLDAGARP